MFDDIHVNAQCIAATIEWKARTTSASVWADPDVYSQDVCAAQVFLLINFHNTFFFDKKIDSYRGKKCFKK
jgi:hypothetical protein